MSAGLLATLYLCMTLIRTEKAEWRQRRADDTEHIAEQFKSGIVAAIDPLTKAGAWWLIQDSPADHAEWQSDTDLFLSRSPGLQEIRWLDAAGRQLWIARVGGGKEDGFTKPSPRIQKLMRASDGRSIRLSAVEDGNFLALVPVWSGRRLRGYVIGTFDA